MEIDLYVFYASIYVLPVGYKLNHTIFVPPLGFSAFILKVGIYAYIYIYIYVCAWI